MAVAGAEIIEEFVLMAMLTVSAGGVPAGTYSATFAGVEPQPADAARGYGAGIRWKFSIESGPQVGQSASRITGTTPSPKNGCGKILSGLLGRALAQGESIDPDQFIGKRYMIVVASGPQGGSRIEAVVPVT